ncbi:hypothetical protein BHM03_00006473, partial [Ensete ventricosum]
EVEAEQEEKKEEKQEKKKEEKAEEKKKEVAKPLPPPPIVLSVDLHRVGCAKKIEKCILKRRTRSNSMLKVLRSPDRHDEWRKACGVHSSTNWEGSQHRPAATQGGAEKEEAEKKPEETPAEGKKEEEPKEEKKEEEKSPQPQVSAGGNKDGDGKKEKGGDEEQKTEGGGEATAAGVSEADMMKKMIYWNGSFIVEDEMARRMLHRMPVYVIQQPPQPPPQPCSDENPNACLHHKKPTPHAHMYVSSMEHNVAFAYFTLDATVSIKSKAPLRRFLHGFVIAGSSLCITPTNNRRPVAQIF